MNEEYLEHFGVKGMKWGVRKAASRERKANVTKAKELHKRSVAKADVAWNREFAKVKKNNPNANYGDLVNKALNTPYVKRHNPKHTRQGWLLKKLRTPHYRKIQKENLLLQLCDRLPKFQKNLSLE